LGHEGDVIGVDLQEVVIREFIHSEIKKLVAEVLLVPTRARRHEKTWFWSTEFIPFQKPVLLLNLISHPIIRPLLPPADVAISSFPYGKRDLTFITFELVVIRVLRRQGSGKHHIPMSIRPDSFSGRDRFWFSAVSVPHPSATNSWAG
jgi:hypothetical protein